MTVVSYRLHFPHLDREIAARDNETVFQSARRHGVRIVGACGGRGTCGSCVVRVHGDVVQVHGQPDAIVDDERDPEHKADGRKWQRACQIAARSDCVVEVAPRSLAPVVRAETDSGEKEMLPLAAAVAVRDIAVPAATLQDPVADVDRVVRVLTDAIIAAGTSPVVGAGLPAIDAVPPAPSFAAKAAPTSTGLACSEIAVDLEAARLLPGVLRAGERAETWTLRVVMRGPELIHFAPTGRRTLGLAIDLGTTNVAGFLVDLESGERLASLGVENPQVAWGADLIGRLNYAVHGDAAAAELRGAAVAAINALAHDLCRFVGQASADIVDLALCGNTAMHHLLLGLPVRQLGRAPFVAAVRAGMDIKARELGFKVAPGAWVHVAPNVGGFVGGDHVAALLAGEDEWGACRTAMVMDIGTNTEISLIHAGRFYTASAPSGPALEGGHISCGMRAAEGAIERVRIENAHLQVDTIACKKAIGLCGSGVLDTLATLHRGGLVSDAGRLAAAHDDIVVQRGKRAVRLAPGVLFTQDDVRAVQLAKAAIRTATELLLDAAGLDASAIERCVIAGSFGAYIDVDSGVAIGLFPDLPRERFRQIGNAAGVGIRRMLASTAARARARELAEQCRYMELSSRGDFQKIFLKHIGFRTQHS